MAHFARVINGIVTNVIVADQEFINSGAVGDPTMWVQASYNTRGGVHYDLDGNPDNLPALRKNFPGVGYTYNSTLDAFISPEPIPINSIPWTLNETTGLWEHPSTQELIASNPPPVIVEGG